MNSTLSHHLEMAGVVADLDVRLMKRTNFVAMTLRSFICRWADELTEYYDEDFGDNEHSTIWDTEFGDTIIYVIVDNYTSEFNSDKPVYDPVPDDIKKKMKKAGKWRRDKLKHQWSYYNPFNRIHGYIVLSDVTNQHHTKKTYTIDAICSSFYTKAKGIGSDLMDLAKLFSEEVGAFDLILEVANEYSGIGHETDDEEEDEETDEEEDEETDEEEDEDDTWYPDESAMSVIASEFWRKCMRLDDRKNPVYNLDKAYLSDLLEKYLMAETSHEYETGDLWEGTEKRVIKDKDEPEENEYGGFWYRRGKNSQSRLMKFYEMHGFKEYPEIHTDWCCFSKIPYPTMKYTLPVYNST